MWIILFESTSCDGQEVDSCLAAQPVFVGTALAHLLEPFALGLGEQGEDDGVDPAAQQVVGWKVDPSGSLIASAKVFPLTTC